MALARIGSEAGPSTADLGPQKLAVTNEKKPGLPQRPTSNRLTGLIAGTKLGRR